MRRTTAYCTGCYRRTAHLDGRCTVCNPPEAEPERTPEPALSLFDRPLQVPAQKRPTSEAAAVEISKVVSGKRKAVFGAIGRWREKHPRGPTDNELITLFQRRQWSINTPRARRVELVNAGLVTEEEEHEGSVCWTLTEFGWAVYRDLLAELAA